MNTSKKDTEDQARFNRIDRLRAAAQDRHLARIERLELKAKPLIGELSSGRFYAFPQGRKYFESDSHTDVVEWLVRNGYVR